MFGYIRPFEGELRVNELELFKACYCGLCHCLKKKYGLISRFILNYELVFLSMLFWDSEQEPKISKKRCIASPIKKKNYCTESAAFDSCAAYNVILTWWKLKDNISDESFLKSIPNRAFSFLLRRAYKKAARDFPQFDITVRQSLASLAQYEANDETSLDAAADFFAQILPAAIAEDLPETKSRPMEELLYHLGRWIYIVDACDDLEKDLKGNRYNAVAVRYPPENGKLTKNASNLVKSTLIHSGNLIGLAFDLLPENPWTQIVGNVIYLGMPYVSDSVMDGSWPPHKTKARNGIDR
ncbi:MAG: DUF5685 family protein [Oscillospiraceae bacterium]|nr:DUF5685 family protein [Oscillospiraceae bacterium]